MIDDNINEREKHFGIVTRVEDEKKKLKLRGAVYFKSDTLTGDSEYPIPAEPSFEQAGQNGEGWFRVPQVGDQIEVELDVNDEHTVPRYVRMIYSDEDEVAEEFLLNYGHRWGYKSRLGNILIMDSKKDPEPTPDSKAGEKKDLEIPEEENDFWKLMHHLGTGFVWTKNGDEIKVVKRDLIETITREVMREVIGKVKETFKAEITRDVIGKLTETFKDDVLRKIQGNLREQINGDQSNKVGGNITNEAGGNVDSKAGGNTKMESGGEHEIQASLIKLNGSVSGITTENSHQGVIDLITGVPVTASTTVMGDI